MAKKRGIPLTLTHNEKQIYFRNDDWDNFGFTDYTEEIYSELITVNWYIDKSKYDKSKKTYIYTGSTKFNGKKDLHLVVMILWYGFDKLKQAHDLKFIVEHHDNNAFNCLIHNLSFASNDINLSKAHFYDKRRVEAAPKILIDLYKDFNTQKYQLTVGFNAIFQVNKSDGTSDIVSAMRFIYSDYFDLVILDAMKMLVLLMANSALEFNKYDYEFVHYTKTPLIYPLNGKLPLFLNYQGETLFVLQEGAQLKQIAPIKDLYEWK